MTASRRIFLTTFGTAFIAVATFVVLLMWITNRVNLAARDEAHARVENILVNLIARNEILTVDYAHWTEAYGWFKTDDATQLYNNLGSGASDSDSFDFIYLLSPDGTAKYVYVSGVLGSDLRNFEPDVSDAIAAEVAAAPLTFTGAITGIVHMAGEVAIVAGARIQPDDLTGLNPADLPIMIGGIWLNPPLIAKTLMINDITVADVRTIPPPDQQAFALFGQNDLVVATLLWPAPRPGSALLVQVAPSIALLAGLLLIGSWIAARFAAHQTEAYLHAKMSARTDPETGLLNRTGLAEIVDDAGFQAMLDQSRIAVLYLDLNGLKELNDTYGHKIGDEAIRITAKRLRSAVRTKDHVARIGGDEFVCLIEDENPCQAAVRISDRLEAMMSRRIRTKTVTFYAPGAIGVAASKQGMTWDALLSQADEAMYRAKRANQSSEVIYAAQ